MKYKNIEHIVKVYKKYVMDIGLTKARLQSSCYGSSFDTVAQNLSSFYIGPSGTVFQWVHKCIERHIKSGHILGDLLHILGKGT